MKFKQSLLFLVFALCIALSLSPSVFGWSPVAPYRNYYNVSNVNWTYTITTAGLSYKEPVGFLLQNLSNVSDTSPQDIFVAGYSQSGRFMGAVRAYEVPQVGSKLDLLISDLVVNGTQSGYWQSISIFFNPSTPINPSNYNGLTTGKCSLLQSQIPSLCAYTSFSYNGVSYLIPDRNIFANGNFSTTPSSQFSIAGTPFQSNTFRSYIYGTLNQSSVIILANRSLNSTQFNVTFNLDSTHTVIINSSADKYQLGTVGLGLCLTAGCNRVLGISQNSPDANFLFNGTYRYDGTGSEFYLSTYGSYNTVIGENVAANKSYVYNSAVKSGLRSNFCLLGTYLCAYSNGGGAGYLNVSANTVTNNNIVLYVMPAFTRNSITSNIYSTNLVNGGISLNCNTGQCTFQYYTLIKNINWTYNFTQHSIYPAQPYNFVWNSVGYVNLSISYQGYSPLFGSACQNIYLTTNSADGSYDPIPFYCSYNNTFYHIVASNVSRDGYLYTQMYIWSAPYTTIPIESNTVILNSWLVGSGSSFIVPVSDYPFQINLAKPLNLGSYIYKLYNGVGSPDITISEKGGTYYMNGVSDQNQTTHFVIGKFPIGGNGYEIMSSYLLSFLFSGTSYQSFNTVIGDSPVSGSSIFSTEFIGRNSLTATATELYTSNYILGQTYLTGSINSTCTVNGCGNPNYTTQNLPNSTNRLPLNATTTIAFNGLSNPVTLAAGVTFPRYDLLGLSLLVMLISIGMFADTRTGHVPFVFMLVGMWIMTFWQYQILYISIPVTILFILGEYTGRKNEKSLLHFLAEGD